MAGITSSTVVIEGYPKQQRPGCKPGLAVGFAPKARLPERPVLFGRGHLFGFAFLAHQLQFALGFFVGLSYFLLYALGRFFELR
jgi:hypothetical protein